MDSLIEEYGQAIMLMIFGGGTIVLFGQLLGWLTSDAMFFA